MQRARVLLPEPFAPRSATYSCPAIPNDTESSAGRADWGYVKQRSFTVKLNGVFLLREYTGTDSEKKETQQKKSYTLNGVHTFLEEGNI